MRYKRPRTFNREMGERSADKGKYTRILQMFARGIVEETSSSHKLKNLPGIVLSISTDVHYNKFPFLHKRDTTCIRVRLTAGLSDHRRAPADKKSTADICARYGGKFQVSTR